MNTTLTMDEILDINTKMAKEGMKCLKEYTDDLLKEQGVSIEYITTSLYAGLSGIFAYEILFNDETGEKKSYMYDLSFRISSFIVQGDHELLKGYMIFKKFVDLFPTYKDIMENKNERIAELAAIIDVMSSYEAMTGKRFLD